MRAGMTVVPFVTSQRGVPSSRSTLLEKKLTNTLVLCYSFVLRPWLGYKRNSVFGVGLGRLENPVTPVDGTTAAHCPLGVESNVKEKICILRDVTITKLLGL